MSSNSSAKFSSGNPPEIDPICSMVATNSPIQTEYQGKKYFFCSEFCKKEFVQQPEKYLVFTPLEQAKKTSVLKTYFPLLLILTYLLGGITLTEYHFGEFSSMRAMNHFMGGFFIIFSFFKLLNLPGFVDAYRTYDLLAKRFSFYAWLYPFIELSLGVAYFLGTSLWLINVITLLVMSVSSLGVIQSLMKKSQIQCACLGTLFQLPMTQVTLFEDLLMVTMAALSLIMGA